MSSTLANQPGPSRKKVKNNVDETFSGNFLNGLQHTVDINLKKEQSQNDIFFKLIAEKMDGLDEKTQGDLQLEMLQMVNEALKNKRKLLNH